MDNEIELEDKCGQQDVLGGRLSIALHDTHRIRPATADSRHNDVHRDES